MRKVFPLNFIEGEGDKGDRVTLENDNNGLLPA